MAELAAMALAATGRNASTRSGGAGRKKRCQPGGPRGACVGESPWSLTEEDCLERPQHSDSERDRRDLTSEQHVGPGQPSKAGGLKARSCRRGLTSGTIQWIEVYVVKANQNSEIGHITTPYSPFRRCSSGGGLRPSSAVLRR